MGLSFVLSLKNFMISTSDFDVVLPNVAKRSDENFK